MNSISRSTLLMLVAYLLVAFALAWWMGTGLRSAAQVVMADTARLIGREVSGALHETSLDNLIRADSRARQRLRDAVETTARASSVLGALSIIDSEGRVVASDDNSAVGKTLSPPEKIFAINKEPQLFSSFAGLFDSGTHLLLTPVYQQGQLVGYIQMQLNNRAIGQLFEAAYWRLLLLGLAGLVAIIAIGLLLHLRLSRLQSRVASLFDSAVAGDRLEEIKPDNDLGRMQNAALRLGRELSAARGRAELRRQELDSVARVLQIGMLLLGPGGKLEFANNAAREMLGGAHPERFAAQFEAMADRLHSAVECMHEGGSSSLDLDIELSIDDEVRRFRLEFHALDLRDSRRFLVIIKDRDMIDALELDLRTATRFRGLATLYVGAAHDLRSPLNNMVVNLELLKQSLKLSGEEPDAEPPMIRQRRHIDVIQQEIYRLNRYVQALLDLTAPAREVRSTLDLVQAITEIAGLVRAQAKLQRVQIDWQAPDRQVWIQCKQVQLRQVLLNIVINALEAMPSGGHLAVALREETDAVVVEITDSGPGIPEALRERIFDMHFTTKDTGTGIGLYVARSVVNELQGEIRVQSALGEGTCVAVRLPVAERPVDEAALLTGTAPGPGHT